MAGALYLYWPGATSYSTITLPTLTDIKTENFRFVADSWGSSHQRLDLGGGRRIRLVRKGLSITTHASFLSEMENLDTFLRAGGRVALQATDSAKTWGGWLTTPVEIGDTTLYTTGNRFPYGSPTLTVNDDLTIESPNPNHHRHRLTVAGYQSARQSLTVSSASIKALFDEPTFIRHRDFYPALFLEEDTASEGEWLTHERRYRYSLDLTLCELPGELLALYDTAENLASTTTSRRAGGQVLNDAVRKGLSGSTSPTPVRTSGTFGTGGRW